MEDDTVIERACLAELCYWFEKSVDSPESMSEQELSDKYALFRLLSETVIGCSKYDKVAMCIRILRPGFYGIDEFGAIFGRVDVTAEYLRALGGLVYLSRQEMKERKKLGELGESTLGDLKFIKGDFSRFGQCNAGYYKVCKLRL